MKAFTRLIALILALVMCFAMAACSADNGAAGAPVNTGAPADTAAPSLPSPTPTIPSAEPEPSEEPEESAAPEESEQPAETPEAAPEESPEAPADPSIAPEAPESTPVPSPEPSPEAPETASVDLNAFYANITGSFEFAMMGAMDNGLLDAFYPGLTAISMKQSICMMPMITGVVCEVMLVECENEGDAAAVKAIFEARKQSQIDGGAYYPESIEAWERAYVVANGSFVALFAHPNNAGDMAAMFDRLFA